MAASHVCLQTTVGDGLLFVQITVSLHPTRGALFLILSVPRIIIFIILHLYYLANFEQNNNKGVAITKPIIFRQAELLFSLFSAAVPALNQYLRKFSTQGAPSNYATYGGGGGYGLKSMTRRTGRTQLSHLDSMTGEGDFGPGNRGNYKATVEYNGKDENDSATDAMSLGRHNSDDMIIRKDVVFNVTYSDDAQLGSRERKSQPPGAV